MLWFLLTAWLAIRPGAVSPQARGTYSGFEGIGRALSCPAAHGVFVPMVNDESRRESLHFPEIDGN